MAEHPADSSSSHATFWGSRLGSALGLLPLGVWTVVHLWHNLAAFDGGRAWSEAVTTYPHPVAQGATLVVVLLPLAIHTAWGVGRLRTTRPNNLRYGFFGNLRYILQRLAAVGVLFFLGAHLWLALLKPRLVERHAETFAGISHEMRHHVPTLVVYLLGTLGVAYHLANGVHGMAMGWGVVSSRRALRRLEGGAFVLFVVLLGMSWAAIFALWRAGR